MNTRIVFVSLFLALLGACAANESPTLRVASDRLFVPVEFNGHKVEALLDSGAEMTVVDSAFAERLSLIAAGEDIARGTGGTAKVQFVQNVDLRAAGVELDNQTVAVIDLSDISDRLIGEPLSIILGRELFDTGRFYLDVEDQRFEKVDPTDDAEGVRLALRDHKGIKQLPIEIEGHPAFADFDLGNGSEMLIGAAFARAHGLDSEDGIISEKVGGGIGGEVSRLVVSLDTLQIGGTSFSKVPAAIDPDDNASGANVGVSILRGFKMTIDFPQNEVWLTR